MRVVADTNIVVSGLLWHGNPRLVLEAARVALLSYTPPESCSRNWKTYWSARGLPCDCKRLELTHELVLGFGALAKLVEPVEIAPVVHADPDDDAVIACAISSRSEIIVSGDSHLLDLKQYESVRIITAAELIAEISKSE